MNVIKIFQSWFQMNGSWAWFSLRDKHKHKHNTNEEARSEHKHKDVGMRRMDNCLILSSIPIPYSHKMADLRLCLCLQQRVHTWQKQKHTWKQEEQKLLFSLFFWLCLSCARPHYHYAYACTCTYVEVKTRPY